MNEQAEIPELNSHHLDHLEWMFDNQPALVQSLYKQNKLKEHLEEVNQAALALVEKLVSQGVKESEAYEQAMQSIMTPEDAPEVSDQPPTPLKDWEKREIKDSLLP